MGDKVVDASALAAILFGEAEQAVVEPQLRGVRLHAPHLLRSELANVCWLKCRRSPALSSQIQVVFAKLPRFSVIEHAIDANAVVRLALATNLTAYDASYLWLARHLAAELVTLDRDLDRAFRQKVP